MCKVISVCMNKGGVGKTSFVSNLAGALVMRKKVLVIDTDGKGNAAIGFGINPNKVQNTIYDVLMQKIEINEIIIPLEKIHKNLDFIVANEDMDYIEFDVLTNAKRYDNFFNLLKPQIEKIKENYDYIFIDTPSSIGLVTGNVLACSDEVIIPFVPELFSVQGLLKMIQAISDFEEHNQKLKINGLVAMMVDQRTILHSEQLQEARKFAYKIEVKMYDTIIPRSILFANANIYGKPAVLINKKNHITDAYFELLEEFLKNHILEF